MRQRSSRGVHVSIFALLPGLITAAAATAPDRRTFLNTYCIGCHNQKLVTAGLALDRADDARPGAQAEMWERVIVKLRAGSMPPAGMPRPDTATYRAVATSLEDEIDRAWSANPRSGTVPAVHRLNLA